MHDSSAGRKNTKFLYMYFLLSYTFSCIHQNLELGEDRSKTRIPLLVLSLTCCLARPCSEASVYCIKIAAKTNHIRTQPTEHLHVQPARPQREQNTTLEFVPNLIISRVCIFKLLTNTSYPLLAVSKAITLKSHP